MKKVFLKVILLLFLFNKATGQNKITIEGVIFNQQGEKLKGVSVYSKGSDRTVITTINGFTVQLNEVPDTLIMSHAGYENLQVPISDTTSFLVLNLKEKIFELDEVTVNTGYQNIPKERATGSFDFLNANTINLQTGTNILQRLKNVSSGLLFNDIIGNKNKVAIRGLSTINGSFEPLIVLDNFIFEGDIKNINPENIKSVTILKDAAAASIWGAKAGNGVIVIETKNAEFNRPLKVYSNLNFTLSEKPKLYSIPSISSADHINVEQFLYNNGFYNRAITLASRNFTPLTPAVEVFLARSNNLISKEDSARLIDEFKAVNEINEYEKYFNNHGFTQQYSVGFSGGKQNMAYTFSAGYDRSTDALNSHSDKLNLQFQNSFQPFKNLKFDIGAYFIDRQSRSGQPAFNSITINGIHIPYLKFADETGKPLPVNSSLRGIFTDTAGTGKLLNWKYYPLEDYKHQYSSTHLQEIIAITGLEYTFFKNLKISTKYQVQKQQSLQRNVFDTSSFYTRNLINTFTQIDHANGKINYAVPIGEIVSATENDIQSFNFRTQASYDGKLKDGRLNAIFGWEMREVNTHREGNTIYGYSKNPLSLTQIDPVNSYPKYTGGTGTIPYGTSLSHKTNRFIAVYSNAAYYWKEKYLFSISARKDASNIFGVTTNNKWNPLWSAGAAWDISNEQFFHSNIFEKIRFRLTYGYSGNVDLSRTAVPVMNLVSADYFTNFFTYGRIGTINNPSLRWERIATFNSALEFVTRNNVLSGTLEWYQKKAVDLYGPSDYDYTTFGLSPSITKNVASMAGKGIELNLNSLNINKMFKWNTNLIFNYYSDKVKSYYSTKGKVFTGSYGNEISTLIGRPVYSLLSYKWGGLDTEGNPQGYLNGKLSTDYNNILNRITDPDSLIYSGSALPKFFGALNNSFSWKGFSVSASLGYEFGFYFRRPSINYSNLFNAGTGHNDFEKRWMKPGDEAFTNIPSMVYPGNLLRDRFYLLSEATIVKGDNLRLQFINFSYDFGNLILSKTKYLSSIKFYFVAENLGIIWRSNNLKIDPHYPAGLSPSKTFTIGLRVNF